MKIKDIAKAAGVSPSTVSMVLNNKGNISDETRQKIIDIAKAGNYTFKKKAIQNKSQVKGQIRLIKYKAEGYLVETNGDFITSVIDGVESEARDNKYNVSITNASMNDLKYVVELINSQDVDGVIFLGTEFASQDTDLLKTIEVPMVILDNQFKYKDFDVVVMNNESGVFMAIEHLYNMGHRRIGHLKSSIEIDNFIARDEGMRLALKHLDLMQNEADVWRVLPSIDQSYETIKQILDKKPSLPSAFFADNDSIAIGAVKAFKEYGINVPNDISVIGFDDLQISSLIDPPLSTISIFKNEMGEQAVKRLVEKIESKKEERLKVLVGPKLVVRESTQDIVK